MALLFSLPITPAEVTQKDDLGDEIKIGRIGVRSTAREIKRHNIFDAAWQSIRATGHLTTVMVTGISQICFW